MSIFGFLKEMFFKRTEKKEILKSLMVALEMVRN